MICLIYYGIHLYISRWFCGSLLKKIWLQNLATGFSPIPRRSQMRSDLGFRDYNTLGVWVKLFNYDVTIETNAKYSKYSSTETLFYLRAVWECGFGRTCVGLVDVADILKMSACLLIHSIFENKFILGKMQQPVYIHVLKCNEIQPSWLEDAITLAWWCGLRETNLLGRVFATNTACINCTDGLRQDLLCHISSGSVRFYKDIIKVSRVENTRNKRNAFKSLAIVQCTI